MHVPKNSSRLLNSLAETHGKIFRTLNLFLSINYRVSEIKNEKASLSFFLDLETIRRFFLIIIVLK